MLESFSIILSSETDDEYIIKVSGDLNAESTNQFEDFIRDLFFKSHKNIKLDLEALNVIVSSAIGSLLLLHDMVSNHQKQMTIVKINDNVKDIISLIGLDNIIII